MTAPGGDGGNGSFARDVGTQTGKAVILILVAVVVAVLLLNHGSATNRTVTSATTAGKAKVSKTTVPASTTTTTMALIPPAQIKLLVLNGTLSGTAASQLTTKLKSALGYQTLTPDDTASKVTSSTIYAVSSQYSAEAAFLAQYLDLQPSAVVTKIPPDAPIHPSEQDLADLVVVIGPDLAAAG